MGHGSRRFACSGFGVRQAEEARDGIVGRHPVESTAGWGAGSGDLEDGACGAEEIFRLAWLGDDPNGLREGGGAGVDARQAAVVTGEDEDGTGGEGFAELGHEGDAIAMGHVDVAEDEVRRSEADGLECIGGAGDDLHLEPLLAEDKAEGSGDEGFVIDDKDAHGKSSSLPRRDRGDCFCSEGKNKYSFSHPIPSVAGCQV